MPALMVPVPPIVPSVPRVVPPRPPDPPAFDYPEKLTGQDLLALFLPLRRDYRGPGFRERARLVRQRLIAYSDALTQARANGVDDATIAVRGVRR